MTIDWRILRFGAPRHYPQHKLRKHRTEESDKTEPAATVPASGRRSGYGARLISRFRPSLQRGLCVGIKNESLPSVLMFKTIRYAPENSVPISTSVPDRKVGRSGAVPVKHAVVPELRHLAHQHHTPQRRSRERLSTVSTVNLSNEVVVTTRRTAKTPVFAIGDLERAHLRRENHNPAANTVPHAGKHPPASTETMDCSIMSEYPLTRGSPGLRQRPSGKLPVCKGPNRPAPTDGNLGSQTCLDLLIEELSAALTTPFVSEQLESELSCLKLCLMIETYEGLRDEVLAWRTRSNGEAEELRVVQNMFDVWVRALQRIYEHVAAAAALPGAGRLPEVAEEDGFCRLECC